VSIPEDSPMTLSNIARDPDTGQLGVATHTGYLAVGDHPRWRLLWKRIRSGGPADSTMG
jgi:hypothetical protein